MVAGVSCCSAMPHYKFNVIHVGLHCPIFVDKSLLRVEKALKKGSLRGAG